MMHDLPVFNPPLSHLLAKQTQASGKNAERFNTSSPTSTYF